MIKVDFGEPHHGWLPVKIESDEYTCEFEASDVPVDPLGVLADALGTVVTSGQVEVWWHLEPAGYYFNFISTPNGYELAISFSKDSKLQNKEHLHTFSGSFSEIILPVWRALKEFYSHNYTEPHWPGKAAMKMQVLTNKLNSLRGKR